MRWLAAAALALVLALLAWFLLRPSSRATALEPSVPAQTQGQGTERMASVESAPVPADRTPLPTPAPPPMCIVLGRVVDDAGRPLAGAKVHLSATQEVSTGRGGEFRFDVPPPKTERTRFEIRPDTFHQAVLEILGGNDSSARPALHAGENDLGLFRLETTGAIRGVVTDADGNPLEGVQVSLQDAGRISSELQPLSDAKGNYLFGHVEPGSRRIRAQREGYLLQTMEAVEVQRERVTDSIDFVLRAAPVLCGIVVDEAGQGLEGAELSGAPSSMRGSGIRGRSGSDGRFRLYLPQEEPYSLEATLAGYESFGLDDHTTHYAPNTQDLRIVLARSASAKTHFVVVDASSGEKLETFGLEIERDRGSASARQSATSYLARPKPIAHPGGELEAFARPGLDRYTVTAPGYVRARGDVTHESSLSPRQVVKLARGSSLGGRATIAGKPAAGAHARLEASREDSQTRVADADGRFRFDSLDAGTYRLELTAPSGESSEFAALGVGRMVDEDLGDLELRGATRILGRVLVPAGRPASGLLVRLDTPFSTTKQTTDADGRFTFEGVPAGDHMLLLDELPGVVAAGASAAVTLRFGETREVQIDARDRGTCKVTLVLELRGGSLEGAQVLLQPVAHRELACTLGRPDAEGRVRGWAPAAGDAQIVLQFPDATQLVHPTALVPLALDHDVDLRVRFEAGTIRIELPPALELPGAGQVGLVLTKPGESLGSAPPRFAVLGKQLGNQHGLKLEADGRHFLAGRVAAGEYEAIFSIHAEQATGDPAGGRGLQQIHRSSFLVTVRGGDTTDVQLR